MEKLYTYKMNDQRKADKDIKAKIITWDKEEDFIMIKDLIDRKNFRIKKF